MANYVKTDVADTEQLLRIFLNQKLVSMNFLETFNYLPDFLEQFGTNYSSSEVFFDYNECYSDFKNSSKHF